MGLTAQTTNDQPSGPIAEEQVPLAVATFLAAYPDSIRGEAVERFGNPVYCFCERCEDERTFTAVAGQWHRIRSKRSCQRRLA